MTTTIIIFGGIAIIILLIVGIVVTVNSDRSQVEQRLNQYIDDGDKNDDDRRVQRAVLTEWVSRKVEKTSFGDHIARDLARADIKLRVSEYLAVMVIAIVATGALAWLVGNRNPISFVIGMVAGFFLPRLYVSREQKQRLKKFNDQLSDMLNLMVNGLRAGYSTMQALESVSKEMPSPIADEFRRVVQEMQIGISIETAMDNLLRRIPSPDLDFMVTAINVQREVGGNLSEILDTISFTIRERVRIKGEIQTLTAQVRTSGSILSFVPFGLTVLLWFLNPEYLMSFKDGGTYCVAITACVVIGMVGSGYMVMMKIADIEV